MMQKAILHFPNKRFELKLNSEKGGSNFFTELPHSFF